MSGNGNDWFGNGLARCSHGAAKRNERKRKRFSEKSTGIVLNGGDRLGNSIAMIAKGTA